MKKAIIVFAALTMFAASLHGCHADKQSGSAETLPSHDATISTAGAEESNHKETQGITEPDSEVETKPADKTPEPVKFNYAVYQKNGNIYWLNASTGETRVIDTDAEMGEVFMVNETEDRVFFEAVNRYGKTWLYYWEPKGSAKAAEICPADSGYVISIDGEVVTYSLSYELYQFNVCERKRERIAIDVTYFRVSSDGQRIVCTTLNGMCFMQQGKSSQLITDTRYDRTDFLSCAVLDDCRTIIYLDDYENANSDPERIGIPVYVWSEGKATYLFEARKIYAFSKDEIYYVTYRSNQLDDVKMYYYDGHTTSLIAEKARSTIRIGDGYLYYRVFGEGEYIAKKGKTVKIAESVGLGTNIDSGSYYSEQDGSKLYYYFKERGKTAALYKVAYDGEKVSVSEHINAVGGADSGYLEICRDGTIWHRHEGNLHINNQKIAEDVGTIIDGYSASMGAYIVDDKLMLYKDGETTVLAENVHKSMFTRGGELLYWCDFDENQGKGKLYMYHNGEAKMIDQNVSSMVLVTDTSAVMAKGNRYYWYEMT